MLETCGIIFNISSPKKAPLIFWIEGTRSMTYDTDPSHKNLREQLTKVISSLFINGVGLGFGIRLNEIYSDNIYTVRSSFCFLFIPSRLRPLSD